MSLLIGGGELWECVARNNSQVLKSGTFDPDIIYVVKENAALSDDV